MSTLHSGSGTSDRSVGKIQTIVVQTVPESVATDNLTMTASFVTVPPVSQRKNYVEEDSTDVFVLERCSPLNDF